MRNLQFLLHTCGVPFLAVLAFGCNADIAENCPKPVGIYKAQYDLVGGNCQPGYQPFTLKFSADDPNSTIHTEQRFADTVTTETLLKGCEVGLKQSVSGESTRSIRSALNGSLAVENDVLHGTVERIDYMEDGATVRCQSIYEAYYSRDSLLLGAAARD
jgi:hypothetical protein